MIALPRFPCSGASTEDAAKLLTRFTAKSMSSKRSATLMPK